MPAQRPPNSSSLEFLSRRSALVALLLTLIATIRIAATYPVFSHTSDEPAHIACGMEWLSKGIYRYEAQHPPLTRVMAALGPYLDGARSTGNEDLMTEGVLILHGQKGETYERRLALSRMGILPLFWVASFAVFLIGRRAIGPAGAVLSVFTFSMLPLVLAHSGLATTDMGATAFFAMSVFCLLALLQKPEMKRAIFLGVSLAGMILSKFSTLAFLPAALMVSAYLYWRRNRNSNAPAAAALRAAAVPLLCSGCIAFLLVWAGYRFSFGPAPYVPFRTPFPELFAGLKQVADHNSRGHLSYFLETRSMFGSWLYFPVLIAVKTPLAVLALAAVSVRFWGGRSNGWPRWMTWTVMFGVLAVAMAANINIGLRHVLPLMPFLSVAAAAGGLALLEGPFRSRLARDGGIACLVLLASSSLLAHPDYLPYFNLLAGGHPEKIAVDSDLDWGQDIKRLGHRLRELGAKHVVYTPLIISELDLFGFPPRLAIDPVQPLPGYNAVSLTQLKLDRLYLPEDQPALQPWPERVAPTEVVGKTILLYSFPSIPTKP